jgi:hypothetical protein
MTNQILPWPGQILDYAEELAGWNDNTKLAVLCDFLSSEAERDPSIMKRIRAYVDDESGCVSESEPEGEEFDGEWLDPCPYWAVEGRDLVEAIFGRTIAREFNY